MKICQVSAFFPPYTGGSERYSYELSKCLVQRGHDVHVYTSRLDNSAPAYEEKDGISIHRFLSPGVIWGINPLSLMMHGFMEEDFDLIHAHSYIFASSNQAALAHLVRGTPYMLHLHGGIDAAVPPAGFSDRFRIYFKRAVYDKSIGRMTMNAANMVASVSRRDLELAEHEFGVATDKLRWIPNAVDPFRFHNGIHGDGDGSNHHETTFPWLDYDGELNSAGNSCREIVSNGSRIVAFIGRLEHWKGIMTFLKVAERVTKRQRNVDFIVVGDGSLLAPLRRSGRFQDGNIHLLGPVQHEKVAEILRNCAMLVLPSYIEGLPTVCLESLASEVPVVASDVGGVSEIVIENETGVLVSPGNVDGCTSAVEILLKNEDLRLKMGKKGRELVEQIYSWESVTEKVEAAYRGLVGERVNSVPSFSEQPGSDGLFANTLRARVPN